MGEGEIIRYNRGPDMNKGARKRARLNRGQREEGRGKREEGRGKREEEYLNIVVQLHTKSNSSLQKINGARTSTRIHIRPRSVLDPVLGARHEHARALTLRALAQRGEARCVASAMRGRSE